MQGQHECRLLLNSTVLLTLFRLGSSKDESRNILNKFQSECLWAWLPDYWAIYGFCESNETHSVNVTYTNVRHDVYSIFEAVQFISAASSAQKVSVGCSWQGQRDLSLLHRPQCGCRVDLISNLMGTGSLLDG